MTIDRADILFRTAVIVAVVLSVWALVGNSPTTTQMLVSGLLIIVTGFYDVKRNLASQTSTVSQQIEHVETLLEDIRNTLQRSHGDSASAGAM